MAVKEERFDILEDEVLIAEVMDNRLLLTDSRNHNQSKDNVHAHAEKNSQENAVRQEFLLNEFRKTNMVNYLFNCAVCANACSNCKSICVTCKSQCRKCHEQSFKNSSTDTDDFDKYLESQTKKAKPQLKTKTIGVDTCDLEGHFDYYKLEGKVIKIQKHVATDCADLCARKVHSKKQLKNTVGVDTSDLNLVSIQANCKDDSDDCEFFWSNQDMTKTYSKKADTEKAPLRNAEKLCEDDNSENSLVIDEDTASFPVIKEEVIKKENLNSFTPKVLTFDDSSTSEDSDVDLATSSKLSKCRKLARIHQITLKQLIVGQETLFECSICSKQFFKKHKGVLHLGEHVESDSFKCLSCGQKFESLNSLYSHVKSQHDQVPNVKLEIENKENSGIDFSQQNKVYHCILCKESDGVVKFDSFKALIIHKKEKHGIDRTTESDGEKTEKKPRIKREFICLICGKQFKSSKALKDHSPVHTGEKNYHCDICKKSYTTSANLKIHKKTHTGAKNFVCSVCGKAFHKKDSLKVHFRKHSGERPFQCDLCPMKFDRNYILKNHRYTHFSEKTFICPVCGKTFTTHGGLNNHEKGHKKDPFAKKPRKPAVKPTLDTENAVICDVCGKIYSTRSNLRIHKFVHLGVKPFECTICHQTYAKKDSMLTHMRKHTDERPFACETCGMTFYRNHTLKTHLLRHTGERPHKCKMCGKSFTQSSSLAYHVKNHDKKVDKKKVQDDANKAKKKRVSPGVRPGRAKKIQKILKPSSGIQADNTKAGFSDKKSLDGSSDIALLKNNPVSVSEKDLTKGAQFVLPVPDKEILVLDKSLNVELSRTLNTSRESDIFSLDRELPYGSQYNVGKFNYYIAKSHVFSVPKDAVKSKMAPKETEITVDKNEEDVENLLISKNSYITKEGNLVTLNREPSLKDVKDFMQIADQRLDPKAHTGVPVTGEILNATFISDENGDVIPLSSMTVQGLGPENVMISPIIPIESDDRKGFFRNSKLAMLDSKVTYNLATGPRISTEKNQTKSNYHVINLKDARTPHKIQIELESPALHIQNPVDDGTLHGMSVFYSNVQPNEI